MDDGSWATLIVEGCTDPAYVEYDATANTDDGSCATLASTCDSPSMDGYDYAVVEIGDQCWFAENLRTTVYADGSAIPVETDNTAWVGLSTGARCDYDNDASNVATYGRLYNWYAATDAAELCPTGWHVPTDDEWTALETYLGANGHSGTEGTALKATSGWGSGGNGTDDFGFSALPGGNRDRYDGFFGNAGYFGYWWSSSLDGTDAVNRRLTYDSNLFGLNNSNKRSGYSVRCLKD
ncbi:fibrobacter succinogenes major paralogous domain-containing protein [Flavobacteriales bacterium]|nr:fibrobacter succinogenes major paralogous domain-containing protein [Flavobacteriales bacterium]